MVFTLTSLGASLQVAGNAEGDGQRGVSGMVGVGGSSRQSILGSIADIRDKDENQC